MRFRSRGSEYWHKLGTVHFLTFTQYVTSTHQWDMFSVYNTDMTHAHKLELPSSFPIVYNLCVTHPIKWPHPWTRSNITKWITAASQKPTPFLQTCPSNILLINEHEIGLGQTKPDHYYVYFHISFQGKWRQTCHSNIHGVPFQYSTMKQKLALTWPPLQKCSYKTKRKNWKYSNTNFQKHHFSCNELGRAYSRKF